MRPREYFRTLKMDHAFELRHYHPSLMVKVLIRGHFEEALKNGSRLLNDYYSGNNYKKQTLQLNSPVFMSSRAEGWEVSCLMPQGFFFTDAPRPMGEELKLIEYPDRQVAVIKFHGKSQYSSMMRKTEELKKWAISSGHLVSSGSKIVVYQSSLLPFMRRNEIHFDAH